MFLGVQVVVVHPHDTYTANPSSNPGHRSFADKPMLKCDLI